MQRTLLKSGRIQIAPFFALTNRLCKTLGLNVWSDTIRLRTGFGKWLEQHFFIPLTPEVGIVVRSELCVLYEDNHLLVVNKPAGLATMGTGDANTVHSLACDYLRQKYQKPGNVYLGVVHRLDSMTSGTLVLARTSKAAARLSEQFRRSSESLPTDRPNVKKNEAPSPQKSYLAVVQRIGGSDWEKNAWANDDFRDGVPTEGMLRDWVVKNERDHRMEVTGKSVKGAVEAVLDFRRVDDLGSRLKAVHQRDTEAGLDFRGVDDLGSRLKAVHQRDAEAVVEVQLRTGRKHQIRVQFASRGYPVWGDVKYGGKQQRGTGIALHAWRLSIVHPTAKTELMFESPVPKSWHQWFPTIRNWPGD